MPYKNKFGIENGGATVSGGGSGDALTSGTLAQFAATTSAELRSVLSDETGGGAAVFATSPTLVTPVISSIVNTGTLTLPTSTDTLVGRATTDTLTNKTLTSPVINVGSDATGDIYYRNSGGTFTRLPIGTNGYVLTVASGIPSWAAAAGGGGASSPLTLTAGSVSEIPLTLNTPASYSANVFKIQRNGTDSVQWAFTSTSSILKMGVDLASGHSTKLEMNSSQYLSGGWGSDLILSNEGGPSLILRSTYNTNVNIGENAAGAYPLVVHTGNSSANVQANARTAANVVLQIKGASSQTANLLEFQTSAGVQRSYFDADGSLMIKSDDSLISFYNTTGGFATGTFNGAAWGCHPGVPKVMATQGQSTTFQDADSAGTVVFDSTILSVTFNQKVIFQTATPASAGATGTTGQFAWDGSYLYICTATNTWKRVAVATW